MTLTDELAAVPAVSVVIGIPLLGEIPNLAKWLGLALVSFGLLLALAPTQRMAGHRMQGCPA